MEDGGAIILRLVTLSILLIFLALILILVFSKRKSAEKPLNKKKSERESFKKPGDNFGVNEMPEDMDEAMPWLENMAKEQETKSRQ